jgi:hypothetical protein
MSKVYAKENYGFVGYVGTVVRVAAGDEYDLEDPFVQGNPDMFTAKRPGDTEPVEEPKRRGRRPADA